MQSDIFCLQSDEFVLQSEQWPGQLVQSMEASLEIRTGNALLTTSSRIANPQAMKRSTLCEQSGHFIYLLIAG